MAVNQLAHKHIEHHVHDLRMWTRASIKIKVLPSLFKCVMTFILARLCVKHDAYLTET
jgi:hypothetical protein